MELHFLGADGLPEHGILALHAGPSRSQARLSALEERKWKLPCSLEECGPIKVEVLESVGRGRFFCEATERTYSLTLELSGADASGDRTMQVQFLARPLGGATNGDGAKNGHDADASCDASLVGTTPGPSARRHKVTLSAQKYLDEHNLVSFFQDILQQLIREKPEDPSKFIAAKLAADVSAAPRDVKASPPKTGSQEDSTESGGPKLESQLENLIEEHPYLEPTSDADVCHPLSGEVAKLREAIASGHNAEATSQLKRIKDQLNKMTEAAPRAHDPMDQSKVLVVLPAESTILTQLNEVIKENPYLEPGSSTKCHSHTLHYWVNKCRESLASGSEKEAASHLGRIVVGLEADKQQISDAFERFDADDSGYLDSTECKHMCAYLGWDCEEAYALDVNQDASITLPEFQSFVGRMGGVQGLFAMRRQRVAVSRRDVMSVMGAAITVGARVRAHFYIDGQKSKNWQEAQVLKVGVSGIPGSSDLGVMLEFGIGCGTSDMRWKARQVVPAAWVISSVEDAAIAAAMREVGILDNQQAFWASVFPESEMKAVGHLVACQRGALAHIRKMATANHETALPEVRTRFSDLGFGEYELQAVLSWIQDLAPVVVHVHLDNIGRFLETDNFYRNQFETKTSCGALDDGNVTRIGWEKDLFGPAYEDAKAFDRPKYGALSVMNDYRGVTSAEQYGDSYMVLKDVRLRCTFAATDSGGIQGARLAVLDKYAHVLQEYNDQELTGIIAVATSEDRSTPPMLLRGGSQDPTKEWATFGFPSLSQQSGRFFFEVELFEGCAAPQLGFASSAFECFPGVGSTSGVGDDEHSWAVDGQNAARWHKGQPQAWGTTWPSTGEGGGMSQKVIVGFAVDLDAREIWTSTDGVWEESPAFGPSEIPEGICLYPALSFMGKAAINFGPDFGHKPPDAKVYERWPGTPGGKTRVDCPRVGNSDILDIYKEAQIHGEVNLNKHVQRLVANEKYRMLPKTSRSCSVRLCNAGAYDGSYRRVGAHAGFPYYKSPAGGIIFRQPELRKWCLSETDDFTSWRFSASPEDGSCEPPTSGWTVPDEERGSMSLAMLKIACAECGIACTDLEQVLGPVLSKDASGQDIVCRYAGETNFVAEFQKLPGCPSSENADQVWKKAVAASQRKCLEDAGFTNAAVVQTEHPYPAKQHSWTRTVRLEGEGDLSVYFASRSVTYDSCANLAITPAITARDTAGVGARVQVRNAHSGTVVNRDLKGVFTVKLDKVADSDILNQEGDMFAASPEEPKTIYVRYEAGTQVSSEISSFVLDKSYPLTPVRFSSFGGPGPAQEAGVQAGWFLDLNDTIFGDSCSKIASLEGDGFGEPPEDMEDVQEDLEAVFKRLNEGVLGMDDVTLAFTNGLPSSLLPEAFVQYSADELICSEIASFRADDYGNIMVDTFSQPGPAQAAGVRSGWMLDTKRTLSADNPGKAPAIEWDMLLCGLPECAELTAMSDVTLVFTRTEESSASSVDPVTRYADEWSKATITGNCAEFRFQTDGDGSYDTDRRWGFFALVVPAGGADEPSKEKIDEVMQGWQKVTLAAEGLTATPSLERVGWDEPRLRALCKRHGWDFEWMTEDGERRRRVCERQVQRELSMSSKKSTKKKSAKLQPDGSKMLPVQRSPRQ